MLHLAAPSSSGTAGHTAPLRAATRQAAVGGFRTEPAVHLVNTSRLSASDFSKLRKILTGPRRVARQRVQAPHVKSPTCPLVPQAAQPPRS
ncbi:hypothetical protein T261_1024 [Streptomyces lydicus]|nr:hypothetical protein T261_1024 [Streptomyces lydicus]